MKIGIGLPNQIRDMDAAVIPRWAERAETAGFSTLATVGRIVVRPGAVNAIPDGQWTLLEIGLGNV